MRRAVAIVAWAALAAAAQAQQEAAPTFQARLVGEALTSGRALALVEELSDRIGPRSTGTPACARAEQWAADKLKSFGYEPRREPWRIDHAWAAGDVEVMVQSPVRRRLHAAAIERANGTPEGGVEGPLLLAGRVLLADPKALAARVRGAVVLVRPSDLRPAGAAPSRADRERLASLVDSMHAAGALAVLVAGADAIPRAIIVRLHGEPLALAVLAVGRGDADFLRRLAEAGGVRVRVASAARNQGPAVATNVLADLRGTSAPDEVVIVHAHLDSMGISPGATDDGAGVAAVLEAARLLKVLDARPRRTIRFALFPGEEQGSLGAWAYLDAHAAHAGRHASLTMDNGAGRTLGLALLGREDLLPAARAAFAGWRDAGLAEIAVHHSQSIGTDGFAFLVRGIPSFVFKQELNDYWEHHHRATDLPDRVKPEDMAFNAAAMATAALGLANLDGPIGRRLTAVEVRKVLEKVGLKTAIGELQRHKRFAE